MKQIVNGLGMVLAMAGSSMCLQAADFPASGGAAVFSSPGTYSTSEDATYSAVTVTATDVSLVVNNGTGGEPSQITVTDSGNYAFVLSGTGLTNSITGGAWNFSNNGSMRVGFTSGGKNQLTLSGVTLATTSGQLVVGDGRDANRLILADRSAVTCKGCTISVSSCADNALEVRSGSTLQVATSSLNTDNAGTPSANTGRNKIVVDGDGSTLTTASSTVFYLGNGHSRNSLVVSNGGKLVVPRSFRIGGRYVKNSSATYFSDGNQVIVSGGGMTVSVENATFVCADFYVGEQSSGNVAQFADAAVTCKWVYVGRDLSASGNVMCISGDQTAFRMTQETLPTNGPYFGFGGFNEFHVTGSFALTNRNFDAWISRYASNNTLRVSNGGIIYQAGGSNNLGYDDARSQDNTIAVDSGGTYHVYRIFVSGVNNRIVVSNGVFSTGRSTAAGDSLNIGYNHGKGIAVHGNGVTLRGTRPSIICPGQFEFENNSYLRFELPPEELESVPIEAARLTLDSSTEISIDCHAYLERIGNGRRTLVLVRTDSADKLEIPDGVLEAANAALPERCSLKVDGNSLVFRVRQVGMTVVVR